MKEKDRERIASICVDAKNLGERLAEVLASSTCGETTVDQLAELAEADLLLTQLTAMVRKARKIGGAL